MTIQLNSGFNKKLIPTNEIPWVDEPMRLCLAKLLPDTPPPRALALLPERVRDMTEATALRLDAEKNRVRDGFLGVLAIVVFVSLAAAMAFGFLINPVIGIVALELTLAYLLFCHLKASAVADKEKRSGHPWLSSYPLGVLISPFILSYYLFSRERAHKNAYDSCQKEVQSYAAEGIRYWSKTNGQLQQRLQLEKERIDGTLSMMQKQPVRTSEGEKRVSEYKDLIEKALLETAKGQKLAMG